MAGYVMNRESLKRHCEQMCKRFGRSDVPYTSGTYGEHRLVLELLEQTEWIPVSERLPENGKNVLVSVYHYDGKPFVYIGFYAVNSQKWIVDSLEYDVVAWMPLPEPYKKEGE